MISTNEPLVKSSAGMRLTLLAGRPSEGVSCEGTTAADLTPLADSRIGGVCKVALPSENFNCYQKTDDGSIPASVIGVFRWCDFDRHPNVHALPLRLPRDSD